MSEHGKCSERQDYMVHVCQGRRVVLFPVMFSENEKNISDYTCFRYVKLINLVYSLYVKSHIILTILFGHTSGQSGHIFSKILLCINRVTTIDDKLIHMFVELNFQT